MANRGNRLKDQRQRESLVRALDSNVLVEAGAGTGKTQMFIERMVRVVTEGICEVENIVAVTFTRKAASQIRERFTAALESLLMGGCDARLSTAQVERVKRAYSFLNRCFIGTIHSFCAHLLRERPVEAGVQPGFEEMEEDEDYFLRQRLWYEYISQQMDVKLTQRLVSAGINPYELGDAFLKYLDHPDVDEWSGGQASPMPPDIRAHVRGLMKFLSQLCNRFDTEKLRVIDDELSSTLQWLCASFNHGIDFDSTAEVYEVFSKFEKPLSSFKIKKRRWETVDSADYEDIIKRWNGFTSRHALPAIEKIRNYRYGLVMELFRLAGSYYEGEKKKAGRLNYQDLLMYAAKLLRDNPHIRRYFRRRYRVVLVDEFQDTDPIQAEVLFLLTATSVSEKRWTRCMPTEGSLFIVGDPKQSIYRFRRADIGIYSTVKTMFKRRGKAGCGKIFYLSSNFRSTERIINWVNDTFEGMFPLDESDASPVYVPLEKSNAVDDIDLSAKPFSGVYYLPVDGGTENEAVEMESELIARVIEWAIRSGVTIPVKGGGERKVSESDFMIITWTRRFISKYAEKLESRGLAAAPSGGSSLHDSDELRYLFGVFKSVLEPDNPVWLLGVLRSGLFGVSDVELYRFAKAGGKFDYRTEVPAALDGKTAEKFNRIFFMMREFENYINTMPPAAALRRIMGELALHVSAGVRADGHLQAGNIEKASFLLHDFFYRRGALTDLVEYLGALVGYSNSPGLERIDTISATYDGSPAVRVMNLHRVKGLEAPIVFLACPYGRKRRLFPDIHIVRKDDGIRGYMAITRRAGYGREVVAHPPGWKRYEQREVKFMEDEVTRLLYVAATRAKFCLIVSMHEDERKLRYNPWQELVVNIEDSVCSFIPRSVMKGKTVSRQVLAAGESGAGDYPKHGENIEDDLNEISRKLGRLETPSYSLARASDAFVEEGWKSKVQKEEDEVIDAASWGSIIHRLLDLAMKGERAGIIKERARELLASAEMDEALADRVVHEVEGVVGSNLWSRARRSKMTLTEVPFHVVFDREDTVCRQLLIRGAIDLVFKEEDGWVIVDYKTEDVSSGDIDKYARLYEGQISAYSRAWEKLTGQKVKQRVIYFVKLRRPVYI